MTVIPEVATILARAASGRFLLEDLVAVLATEDLERCSAPDEWSVRQVLAHVASSDVVTADLVASSPSHPADLDSQLARREDARRAFEALAREPLLRQVREARRRAVDALSRLEPGHLERQLRLPVVDAWGQPRAIGMRGYLAAWAEHDAEHTAQVRDALRAPLNPSLVALTVTRGLQSP